MNFTSEKIRRLLIEKITGSIDPEDDLAIEQLLHENDEVRAQWQAIQEQVQFAESRRFSIEADVEEKWRQIALQIKKPQIAHSPISIKIAAAAAILAFIVCAIYLFNKGGIPTPAIVKLSDKEKGSRVSLALDNGETIYLKSSDKGTFSLGSVSIHVRGDEISYTNGKAATQEWSTLSVPAIMNCKIKLSDSTEVWMNSKTRLRFPLRFSGKTREVYVEGEAYFKVQKSSQQFIVHADKTAIKVFGTRFNVNSYDVNKIRTSLVEGSIAATSNKYLIRLYPGFEAVYSHLHQRFKVSTFDQSEVLSWMKGIYFFHNNSLEDLSKLLTRWYNVSVKFENPSLQDRTFSGEINKNQPIQLFLDNIRISNNINLEFKDEVVYFK